eukprot:SAG31_NODE_135_length_23206_cov_25.707967_2_plen_154_part_00
MMWHTFHVLSGLARIYNILVNQWQFTDFTDEPHHIRMESTLKMKSESRLYNTCAVVSWISMVASHYTTHMYIGTTAAPWTAAAYTTLQYWTAGTGRYTGTGGCRKAVYAYVYTWRPRARFMTCARSRRRATARRILTIWVRRTGAYTWRPLDS